MPIVMEKLVDGNRGEIMREVHDMFVYHSPNPEQLKNMTQIRDALENAFNTILEYAPPSADRSAALRKLREARMDANSSIVHNGKY